VVIGDFKALSGFDAQDAREMAGFLAREFGGALRDLVYKKSSPGHSIL
jgi:hypothetical protein